MAIAAAREVALRAIDSRSFIVTAERLLQSEDSAKVAVGVVALTGRKPSDVLRFGAFKTYEGRDGEEVLGFSNNAVEDQRVETLCRAVDVVSAVQRLRGDPRIASVPAGRLKEELEPAFLEAMTRRFGADINYDDLRGMYAAVAKDLGSPLDAAQMLGFSVSDTVDQAAFMRYTAPPVAELSQALRHSSDAFRKARLELQSSLWPEREPSSDRSVIAEYLKESAARRLGDDVVINVDVPVARIIASETLQMVTDRQNAVEREMRRDRPAPLPLTPHQQTEQNLAQARDDIRKAGELRPAERERVADLQRSVDAAGGYVGRSAQWQLNDVYLAADIREDLATREYFLLKERITAPEAQAAMRAEYQQAVAERQPALAVHEERFAQSCRLGTDRALRIGDEVILSELERYGRANDWSGEAVAPLTMRFGDGEMPRFDDLANRQELLELDEAWDIGEYRYTDLEAS